MTTLRQIELESIFLISIVAAASLFFVVSRNNNYQPQLSIASAIPAMKAPAEVISSKVTISSQISPDGTKKAIMKVTQNPDNTSTYDFATADKNGANEKSIFTRTLDSSKSMTIPFNTWSPDNKYFFIKENAGDNKSVFAFKASGAGFSKEENYFDVTDLFKKRNTGNNFSEATGWASESLIIINTTKENGTKGPSYWFELPSKAIIPLATEF